MATGRSMQTGGPTLASPPWAGDALHPMYLVPGGAKLDDSQFVAPDAVSPVVGVAGAAGAATSIPVAALTGAIPSGTVLNFGTNKFARLTAAAAAGATSLTVAAIPTALVSGDTATYPGTQKKIVPSGTPVGRTIAERDAGTGFGPAVSTDDEIYLTAWDVDDAAKINDVDLARHDSGLTVKETFLPGWANHLLALKTAIRARYHCVRGAD